VAGLLNGEEALLQANLTGAAAGWAGFGLRAWLGAGAMADFTLFHGGNADLGLGAMRGLFQRDFQVVTQVGTTIDVGATPATATTAKNLVKNSAKGIGKAGAASPTKSAHARLRIDAGVAVLVIGRPLLWLRQYLVSLFGFLEFFFC
jgi:hypothetical protein